MDILQYIVKKSRLNYEILQEIILFRKYATKGCALGVQPFVVWEKREVRSRKVAKLLYRAVRAKHLPYSGFASSKVMETVMLSPAR